jgi:hypothetical protein
VAGSAIVEPIVPSWGIDVRWTIAAWVCAGWLSGCFWGGDDAGGDDAPAACTVNADCHDGQVCAAGRCVAEGAIGLGGMCSANRDCASGLYCATDGVCAAAGNGVVDDPCATGADCRRDLVCELYGFGGTCILAGSGDLGDACEVTRDCIAGLACGPGGTCVRTVDAYPPFGGVTCPPDESPFRAYFEVPRPGRPVSDFFKLPFPNDARIRADGTLDLDDFPRPGPSIIGVDVVDLHAEALAADFQGFSPIANVTFRFSKQLDFDSLGASGANVQFVDITDPASGQFGAGRGRAFSYDTDGGRYACRHVFQVAPQRHEPLSPGHTYAVYLTTAIRSNVGETPVQDPDLVAVLGDVAPADATLAAAWTRYANFRTYLAGAQLGAGDIAGVAVFTVQDTTGDGARSRVLALAEAVAALPLPALTDLTVCDGSTPSPCQIAGDAERVCGDSSGAFWEIHGRLEVPRYQRGTPPFERPADGGAIEFGADGAPSQVGTVDVCFALTVPKSPTPGAGWPLVVHGHGTGGSFKAAVTTGIAAALATSTPAIATLTFDGVGHGERRGGSTRSPDGIVLNLVNPRAARDNHLQGAVDVIQALRVAQIAPRTVGAVTLDFDPARTSYFGHSQGANVGIPALAATDLAQAAVLSGAGSWVSDGLLKKTSPVDAAAALSSLVGDTLTHGHPVMTIWQTFFDPIDPVSFDAMIVARPPPGVASKHVHLIWGQDDTFSPESTMTLTARTARLQLAAPVIEEIGLATVPRPVSGNRIGGDGRARTAACYQYASDGSYDGHFVSTRNPSAIADWTGFLTSAAATGTPTVP